MSAAQRAAATRQSSGTSTKAMAGKTMWLTVPQPELCSSDPAKKDALATAPKT